MNVLIPSAPLAAARIDDALLARGFARVADFPFESGVREIRYRRGEGAAMVVVGAAEGATALKLEDVEEAIAHDLVRALEAEGPDALLAAARAAREPRVAARSLARLAVLFFVADPTTSDEALDIVLGRLTDPHPIVRWTASAIVPRTSRRIVAAFEAAKDRFPELGREWERMRELARREEEGTLRDTPTDDERELARRAAEGVEKKQWKRVELAAEAWLAKKPESDDAAYHRALAHQGRGEVLLALAWIAGAVRGLKIDADATRKVGEESGDAHTLRDAAEKERKLARAREALEAIRTEARALPEEARSAAGLVELFERWAGEHGKRMSGSGTALGSAAEALAGLVPEIEPILRWLRVSTGRDATDADREALVRDAADSPWVWRSLAEHLADDDPAASARAWDEALRRIEAGGAPSPLAARIARLQELAGETLGVPEILTARMRAAYDRKAWDEAAARADALVARDPDSSLAWQIRANARTFALRHDEAVPAYDDAIRAMTRLIDDEGRSSLADRRPTMEFNRACVLAKLGRREEALEGLRRAVKGDETWAEKATKDDYFEALWQDPDFLAVVRGDAAARLLAEERTPGHVLTLVQQANQAIAALDAVRASTLATQALSIARTLGIPALSVAAGMVAGYVTVAKGDVDAGLSMARAARGELDRLADEDPRFRAEQLAEYVSPLTLAQRWDEAEAACVEARAARVAAFGEVSLPVVLSFGQLAGIQIARGAPADELAATFERASALLDALLAKTPEDAEAHAQRGSVLTRRAQLTDDAAARIGLLEGATASLEKAAELGSLRAQHVDGALFTVEQTSAPAELRARLGAVYERLTTLLFPDPAVRAERLFWRRIRQEIHVLRALGHEDAAIVEMLGELLRGSTPEAVRDFPGLSSFPEHMARHMAGYPTLAVLAPMALETAAMNGDVLEAIEQIEGLLTVGGEDDDGDYDVDDGGGDDEEA